MKGLIRDILTFLRELQENNDREWFAGQKPRYQKLKEGFDELVDRLIAQTAVWDEEVKNLKAKDCVYRIYRDIRFSPDRKSVLIKIILPLISVVGGDVTADVVGIISTSNRGVVCWAGGVIVRNRLC